MTPDLAAALQLILDQLCLIRQVMQRCCEQSSCTPAKAATADGIVTNVSLTTNPVKILGVNRRRLAFAVGNTTNAMAVMLGIASNSDTSGGGTGIVPAGQVGYFTAYQYPSSITREWYAWSASGTPTISVQEELGGAE